MAIGQVRSHRQSHRHPLTLFVDANKMVTWMTQPSLFPGFNHHAKPARPPADPCARKHQGNPASVAAFERCKLGITTARMNVYEWLHGRGQLGGTLKAYCRVSGKLPNEASPRFTELRQAGLIVDSGSRDDGCTVWVAVEDGK